MNLEADISDIELKQRWRLYWIHCIFEFSHAKLQYMSWIQGSNAEWTTDEGWLSSFEECNASYFDNLALDDNYIKAIACGNVSKEEALRANTFHQRVYLYIEPSENPEEILKDPEWLEITSHAKEFWNYLKRTVVSQRERDVIQSLEKEFC
ncbi:hypothetical protein JHD48_06855 [Sulfurimonas sp. SAG-AH-194-I05]|nr:hypothetical protein [Sulfurimonas sp. SAG-AH-194-I05]MDF1875449.1 hypothetical protein [Sulfurimonas sp. SAG-AH-194-I05]